MATREQQKQRLAEWNKRRKSIGLPPIPSVEDLRDDTVSLLKNEFGPQWKHRCHDAGGPTVHTLSAWEDKTVYRPQSPTLRMALYTINRDLGIVPRR